MMDVTILGSGAFGLSLGKCFFIKHHHVKIWSKFETEVNSLKDKYAQFQFTSNLKEAIYDADIIVIAIPIEFIKDTLQLLKKYYHKGIILIASKGIEVSSSNFAYQMVENILPNVPYGVLSGGTFAKDMMNGYVMGITLATHYSEVVSMVKNGLDSKSLRVEVSKDIIGVSICGAVKNVMAIGFGILDGAGYPESSRFLFLTEAILEIKSFIKKLGGDEATILSYAGIDDIMMTCTSSESRNYTLGKMMGQKLSRGVIQEYRSTTTVEGLGTSKAIFSLLKEREIDSPLIQIIYQITYEDLDIHELIHYLEIVQK